MRPLTPFIVFLFLLILQPSFSSAQGEGNNWNFGLFGWIDFNSGNAVSQTGSALNNFEGCSSISDPEGKLLFYTDGEEVWNAQHNVMPNGDSLKGKGGTTQSCIIIQRPGSDSLYYIFTVDEIAGPDGVHYSEVDMTLDNCRGDVTTNKNVPLFSNVTERLTAVRHANGTDIWVILHVWNSDAFVAFLVTSAGVNTTPVTSNVGSVHTFGSMMTVANNIGYLKASHDGARLAVAIFQDHKIEVFDFNNATGVITNPITIQADQATPSAPFPYGLEFSPDNTKLYASALIGQVTQYDLTAGTAPAILASAVQVGNSTVSPTRALQLAPDGRIYVAKVNNPYLGAITNPNALGLAANYVDSALFLSPNSSLQGLPNFMAGTITTANFNFLNPCFGATTLFTIPNATAIDSVLWNFGDPGSGSQNTSTTFTAFHSFTTIGSYTVTLTYYIGGVAQTSTRTLTIFEPPVVNLGPDSLICEGDTVPLMGPSGATLEWQDGSACEDFTAIGSGTYWLTATNVCGSVTDSLNLIPVPPLGFNLGNDTIICNQDTLLLDPMTSGTAYLWNDSSQADTLLAFSTGLYWVQVTDTLGCLHFDSIQVNVGQPINLGTGNDTTLCPGDTLVLDANNPDASILWQNGDTTQTFTVTSPGTYSVIVTDSNNCQSFDTIVIDYSTISVSLGNDTSTCTDSLLLFASPDSLSYLWNTTDTTDSIWVTVTNQYSVVATDSFGCVSTDSINVIMAGIGVNLGGDVGLCPGQSTTLNTGLSGVTTSWSTGDTTSSITVSTPGTYSVTVTNPAGCSNSDTVEVTIAQINLSLPASQTICNGDSFSVSLNLPGMTFSWENGSTSPDRTFTSAGTYSVTVTTGSGCTATDQIEIIVNNPSVSLGPDTTLCGSFSILVTPSITANSYLWQDGSTEPTILATAYQTYAVTITDNAGCTASDDKFFLEDCAGIIFIPNVFSPNQDGRNDIFLIETEDLTELDFHVFNRWGQELFHTTEAGIGWDGKCSGGDCPEGTYFWTMRYKGFTDEEFLIKGEITLLR